MSHKNSSAEQSVNKNMSHDIIAVLYQIGEQLQGIVAPKHLYRYSTRQCCLFVTYLFPEQQNTSVDLSLP